jgi:hypothetical protein
MDILDYVNAAIEKAEIEYTEANQGQDHDGSYDY